MINNLNTIKGTIHAIDHKIINGKKDPDARYDKYIITLEVTGKPTEYPQLEAFNKDLSNFVILDFVEIDFKLSGQKFKGDDGKERIINRSSIISIKYADLQTSKKHIKHVDDSKVDYKKLMVEVDAPEIGDMNESDLPF